MFRQSLVATVGMHCLFTRVYSISINHINESGDYLYHYLSHRQMFYCAPDQWCDMAQSTSSCLDCWVNRKRGSWCHQTDWGFRMEWTTTGEDGVGAPPCWMRSPSNGRQGASAWQEHSKVEAARTIWEQLAGAISPLGGVDVRNIE